MDSNYPEVTLALTSLVVDAADRVRREGVTVTPKAGLKQFELGGSQVNVPEFESLNGELLYCAVTEGVNNPTIRSYFDSVLAFASGGGELSRSWAKIRTDIGCYCTTEAELLQGFASATEQLSREEGLRLVRHCCDRLEAQVKILSQHSSETALEASINDTAYPFPSS
jgi:carboxylate-amine ligase